MAKIKTQVTAHAREDVKQKEPLPTADNSAKLHSHFGNQYGSFSENWNIDLSQDPTIPLMGNKPKVCSIIQ